MTRHERLAYVSTFFTTSLRIRIQELGKSKEDRIEAKYSTQETTIDVERVLDRTKNSLPEMERKCRIWVPK